MDCDPGIDDAVALALAIASPEVELQAVTTVSGNASVDVTTQNALHLLRAFGGEHVPVAAGATRALVRIGHHGQVSPHGLNGLGGVELGACRRRAVKEHAVDRLAAVLDAAGPRSVTVTALGPLTNIALLLSLHPGCVNRIDRLVVMGGSIGPGNITPAAEFNVWTDPEAARRVLADSGLHVCLVGLDVTRQATVDDAALAQLRAASEQGGLLADMILAYGDRTAGGWPLHDVLAVASVIDPTLIETRPGRVEVDTGLGAGRGRTVCTFFPDDRCSDEGRSAGSATRCDVAVGLDRARFRELVLARVPRRAASRHDRRQQ